jgi:hypothetical protein
VRSHSTAALPAVTTPATPRKRDSEALRVAGWLAGDFFVLAPSLLLFAAAGAPNGSAMASLIFFSVPALLLALVGVCIWGVVESLYVPEGLLYFAGHNMRGCAAGALVRGVTCNVQNELGETPLLLAVSKGHSEMVKILLLSGADPTIPDRFGLTALGLAQAQGRRDMTNLMGQNGNNAGSARPDHPPVRRSHTRRRLLVLALAGALLWIAATIATCERVEINALQFDDLGMAGELATLDLHVVHAVNQAGYVSGEVKDPDHPLARAIGLRGRRFWVRWPGPHQSYLPWKRVHEGASEPPPADARPGIWSIVLMVAWSLLVVGLLPQLLVGLRGLYPFLALSARARPVAPLAQAGKTSFGDPQR